MEKTAKQTAMARQVELIIRRLNSLSTLPQVAAGFLSYITKPKLDRSQLARIIENDPALTAQVLALAKRQRISPGFGNEELSVAQVVSKLPEPMLRDAILSVKVFEVFDSEYDPDSKRQLPRKQLALHALAVACCAREITAIVLSPEDEHLAFTAGLLHDIGKLALDEVMPKSFEKIVNQACRQKKSMCDVEQQLLGLDHCIVGRHLAEKWDLPAEIGLAIWLHHSDTLAISSQMPTARIAQIVRLADRIARQCGIGMSGSFDQPFADRINCHPLPISEEQVKQIISRLPEQVLNKSQLLSLDNPSPYSRYSHLAQAVAAAVASENDDLSQKNKCLSIAKSQVDFINDFLQGLDISFSANQLAEKLLLACQKHLHTGPAIVLFHSDTNQHLWELVGADSKGNVNISVIEDPGISSIIPPQLHTRFAILPAHEYIATFFEKIDFEIDLSKSVLLPLLAFDRFIGFMVFQHRLHETGDDDTNQYCFPLSVGSCFLSLAMAKQRESRMCEQFAQLLGTLQQTRDNLARAQSMLGIAEMAAGAAHELNTPLAIISGRAQLLCDTETDPDKKQMLKQICERTEQISEMIAELMDFARPRPPEPAKIELIQLLHEAVGNVAAKHNLKNIEAAFKKLDQAGEVFIDPSQTRTAVENILSNALESYKGGSGPVRISGDCPQEEGFASFNIIDMGCGMDAQTLAKAAQPFFSDKPAGRKKGMGLAQATRLLHLNKASINIQSLPGSGTTVTIRLPRN